MNLQEIKIGMIGAVDSSKTSTISVMIHNELDDGNGKARNKIVKLKHEKESGRTSSISENFLIKPELGKYLTFVDLAGHEKYLRTTMHGLAGYYIDYAVILVGGNMGVSKMTHEHLIVAITLKIPFIFLITKIDLTPEHILQNTIKDIMQLIKKYKVSQTDGILITDENKISEIDLQKNCPIFLISNKNGTNIDIFRNFLVSLPCRFNWQNKLDKEQTFIINNRYNVKGIGIVLSGKVISGKIKKGDKLQIGLFNDKWKTITVRSLHNNFRTNVEELQAGESGCIAINSKIEFSKKKLRKGAIIISENKDAIWTFDAEVTILTKHSTSIYKGYTPIVYCNTVVQTAKILDIYEKAILRCGDKAKVKFKFLYRPECINVNERIIFRDGMMTKGFGKVIKIYNPNNKNIDIINNFINQNK